MNVTELKEQLAKVEDPDGTIVVVIKDKGLVEADMYDFLHGEYEDFNTSEVKINDIFVIY